MATIIWCDHVQHLVQESRTDVEDIIAAVAKGETSPPGFGYFTDAGSERQRALNVRLISSFEPAAKDGV